MKKLILFILLLPSLAFAQCVEEKEVIDLLNTMINEESKSFSGFGITTTECNPCKCLIGGMAACYEYMAQQERAREKEYERRKEIVDRVKKCGICREEALR